MNLFSLIENLHSKDPEDEEKDSEDEKKTSYYWKNLSEGFKQSFEVFNDFRVEFRDKLAEKQRSKEKGDSKHPKDPKQVINGLMGTDKEEHDVDYNEKRVYLIPSVSEVSLRSKTD